MAHNPFVVQLPSIDENDNEDERESNYVRNMPPNLKNNALESLDLSQNNLPGEIPQQLKQLTLSFNVSHNNLRGLIHRGNQFNSFESSYFQGIPGLCGDPLLKKCADLESSTLSPPVFEENDDAESLFKLDWKFVLAGS
nr:receptor-like protein 9DC3 [Ziziphus jujuba var. spinosa]